jgi:alpha-beta hydrolase superfamily lysophospholipase
MSVSDQEIISRFPVGYYQLHPNVSLNFQMNRFWDWVGEEQMLDELRAAGPRIASYPDWIKGMLELSDKALADRRLLPAAYYARMANFFLPPDDPRRQPALKRFMDNVLPANGVAPQDHHMVPYQQGQLSAYRFIPAQPRGTMVVFGGFDSYIEEWLPAAIAFRDAGLDTVVFNGPGQGTVLDAGMPISPDWHLPVAAILDYFGLSGITLAGFSLGGCLVIRAAAREPRVARAIAWDICTDFYAAIIETALPAAGLDVIAANFGQIPAAAVDAAVAAAAKTDLMTDWVIAQGERVMGASTPADMFRAWSEYHTRDTSPLVTQDVLLMAGTTDHAIPFHQLPDQLLTLTAARSVTARVFTEAEDASSHCQCGNTGLAIKVILDWMDQAGGRTALLRRRAPRTSCPRRPGRSLGRTLTAFRASSCRLAGD